MKKSLILVGMLVIGYANAQEGTVGINTSNPKATLDIQPNATNLVGTTNEGLLIPRLTKARVVGIATGNLVEGTKVYVTDEVTAEDTQFIGIGKGFYFYNGTKWVKQLTSDTDTNSELWAQRDNAGVTETYLKPANDKTDVIEYTSDRRWKINLGNVNESDLVWDDGSKGFSSSETPSTLAISSDLLPQQSTIGGNRYFYFSNDNYLLKNAHASINPKSIYIGKEHRFVAKDITSPMGTIFGLNSSVDYYSTGNVEAIIGSKAGISHGDGKNTNVTATTTIAGDFENRNYGTSSNVFGIRTRINNTGVASNMTGIHNSIVSGKGTHSVNNMFGIYNESTISSDATLRGKIIGLTNTQKIGANTTLGSEVELRTLYSNTEIDQNASIDNTYVNILAADRLKTGSYVRDLMSIGIYPTVQAGARIGSYKAINISNGIMDDNAEIDEVIGLNIRNVYNGKKRNFAIYTNRGIVHLGDKLGVGTETPTQRIEANGNIFANEGALISSIKNSGGGYLQLDNLTKTEGKAVNRWRIYNMNTVDTENYVPGLHFWAYAADGTNLSSQMVITDAGNVGIGFSSRLGTSTQTNEKLEVNGAIKVANTTSTCSDTNRGTIKFENDNFYGCKSTGWVLLNN